MRAPIWAARWRRPGDGWRMRLAVALGSAGYIQQFVDLPQSVIVVIVIAVLGAVAAWGILESVLLASVFTLIETGGLVVVIVAGIHADLPVYLPFLPSLALRIWPMSLRRPKFLNGTFHAPWC
jgi:hypothetical protein